MQTDIISVLPGQSRPVLSWCLEENIKPSAYHSEITAGGKEENFPKLNIILSCNVQSERRYILEGEGVT